MIKDNLVVGLVMGLNQGFGLAIPASIVKTVLTNWGVALASDAVASVKPDISVERKSAPRLRRPPGRLALDTNRLEFGDQEVCVTQEKTIRLTNRSSSPLSIQSY